MKKALLRVLKELRTQKVRTAIAVLLLVWGSGLLGGVSGYYAGTGELPPIFSSKPVAILPPMPNTSTTLVDVGHFLEEDATSDKVYEEGFNCVEYALLVARNAQWFGLAAEACSIVYEDGSRHMIVMFPTEDNGWTFIEPQSDKVITPVPGSMYNGNRVLRIDRLDMQWVPFLEASNVK